MLEVPILRDENLAAFERDGFVIVPGGFSTKDIADIERWTTELAEIPAEVGKQWVYYEKSQLDPNVKLICRIENIAAHHAGFREFSEVLQFPVGQILGEAATIFKEKVNYKMPGGDGFKPHQDSQAGWGTYADYFISVMVCIDEATIENGCLQLVARHQNRGLHTEWEPLPEAEIADMDFQYCETQPGDIVFFDSFVPHASEANLSDKIRRMYFATYNRLSDGKHIDAYYADKRKTYPPDIEREVGKEYVFKV